MFLFLFVDFQDNYSTPECANDYNSTASQLLSNSTVPLPECERDVSLLYLLLLLGNLWLGVTLYTFTKT